MPLHTTHQPYSTNRSRRYPYITHTLHPDIFSSSSSLRLISPTLYTTRACAPSQCGRGTTNPYTHTHTCPGYLHHAFSYYDSCAYYTRVWDLFPVTSEHTSARAPRFPPERSAGFIMRTRAEAKYRVSPRARPSIQTDIHVASVLSLCLCLLFFFSLLSHARACNE